MNFIKFSALVLLFSYSIILFVNPNLGNRFSLNLYVITVMLTTLGVLLNDVVEYHLKIKKLREEKQKIEKQVEAMLLKIMNNLQKQNL